MKPTTLTDARAAKAEVARLVGRKAEIVGLGITEVGRGYGVKVNLRSARGLSLPDSVGGVPVRVEIVGPVRKR